MIVVGAVALALLNPWVGPRAPQQVTSPLIDRTKPAVYLTYLRSEVVATKNTNAAVDLIWLELRNNTRWRIIHTTVGSKSGDSGWCYKVVTDDYCHTHLYPEIGNCGDFRGFLIVEPGQRIAISVPSSHLSRGQAIETEFRFEWEPDSRVRHSLWLGHSDLPSQARPSIAALGRIALPRNECNAGSDMTPLPNLQSVTPLLMQMLNPLSGAAASPGAPKDTSTAPREK